MDEYSPEKLRNTILFLIGINVYLRVMKEHYYQRHPMADQPSQLSFEANEEGDKCLVHEEDTISKTLDGLI